MKKTAFIAMFVFCIIFAPQTAFPQTRESFLKWFNTFPVATENDRRYKDRFAAADSCMGKYLFEESNKYCTAALQYNPRDYLVRAMMCLNYYELGEALSPKIFAQRKKKLEMYATMVRLADEGIRYRPDKGECYFMRGLANARIATTKGILSCLVMGKAMEADWQEAVKHNSEYVTPNGENLIPSCYIALGSFYRLCPSFFLLKLFFGINGDINRSIDCCKKAFDMDPTRIEIVKEYGISLITRGLRNNNSADREKGKEYLRLAGTLRLRLRTDALDKEHCKLLLDNIKLCPDYSRDQQQETSEEAVRKKIK